MAVTGTGILGKGEFQSTGTLLSSPGLGTNSSLPKKRIHLLDLIFLFATSQIAVNLQLCLAGKLQGNVSPADPDSLRHVLWRPLQDSEVVCS